MTENIKYRQLKGFAAIVETGSFKAGAERLAITQPSFSALIKELEQDVGVTLCDRSTRGCTISKAGLEFYRQITGPLGQLEHAYRHLKATRAANSGHLSLATSPSLCSGMITSRLAEFQRRYPGVRLTIRERRAPEVLSAVLNNEVEIGIGSILRNDPALVFQPLLTDHLMIITPRSHPLRTLKQRTWRSLDGHNLILLTGGPSEHAVMTRKVQPRQILEVEHAATALSMVRHRMGVTILPSSVVESMSTKGLVLLRISDELTSREVGVIHRKDVQPSSSALAFCELLRETPRRNAS